MLFKSLPCGAKTCWRARAIGLASSLLPVFLLVPLAQAQTGYHILSVPGSTGDLFGHMAVDGNGKMYIAARCYGRTDGGFSVIAVLPDGSLDPAWGTGGVVSTKLTDYGSEARGIAIQTDGKIVVTGNATRKLRPNQYVNYLAVVRYNSDGTLDRDFNYVPPSKKGNKPETYGTVIDSPGYGWGVMVQGDGKIVVEGLTSSSGSGQAAPIVTWRYHADGTVDTTYGTAGRAEGYFGDGYLTAAPLDPVDNNLDFHFQGGGILCGARIFQSGLGQILGFMRFQANGLLDPNFASGGVLRYSIPDTAQNVVHGGFAVDADDRIVTIATPDVAVDDCLAVVYRFNLDGSLDPTFGAGRGYRGINLNVFGFMRWWPQTTGGLVLDADGKAVIAGYDYDHIAAFVARVDMVAETLDLTFGETETGVVLIPTPPDAYPQQVAIRPDGRIVVAGNIGPNRFSRRIFFARFLPDGTPDPSF